MSGRNARDQTLESALKLHSEPRPIEAPDRIERVRVDIAVDGVVVVDDRRLLVAQVVDADVDAGVEPLDVVADGDVVIDARAVLQLAARRQFRGTGGRYVVFS